jgi:hypothetical protein
VTVWLWLSVNFEESSRFIAPLQLKRFNVGSKKATTASAPVLPNQKKNSVAKSPDSLTHPVLPLLMLNFSTAMVPYVYVFHATKKAKTTGF